MKTYKSLSSVIRSVVTEAHTKDHPPFTPDEKSSFKKPDNKNRTGMDAAKALARRAMQKKMKESFDLDISEEEADDLLNYIQEVREIINPKVSRLNNKKDIEMKPTKNYGLSDSLIDVVRNSVEEALKGGQKKLDVDKDGKLEKSDFASLRAKKEAIDTKPKLKEEEEQMDEVKLADLPRRKVVGKSYGADYVDPEGADDADMKKAEPKRKSGPQGTMKRRFDTKSYAKLKSQYK